MTTYIEDDFRTWLASLAENFKAFYQHLAGNPGSEFAWFRRAGDDSAPSLDDSGEPDIIYWDVELYSSSLERQVTLCRALRAYRDHRGALGSGVVEDIQVTDQQDDYEPQASGNTLPPFMAAFRVITTGYEASDS